MSAGPHADGPDGRAHAPGRRRARPRALPRGPTGGSSASTPSCSGPRESDTSALLARVELRLERGDVVLLYTDGITGAENVAGEQYGTDRLCATVRASPRARSAQEIEQAIVDDLMNFIGARRIRGDITAVVLIEL